MLLDRWQTHWHALFVGTLAVSTVVGAVSENVAWRRALIVLLAAALAAWYVRAVVVGRRFSVGARSGVLLNVALGVGLWVPLLLLQGVFQLLVFSAYSLACSAPARRAIVGIAAVSAIVVATQFVREGSFDPVWLVFYAMVSVSLGLLVAMTQAIHEQSEERRRLIDGLEATRAQLAASERRAGMLGERQRLAHEIHDTLAQGFASIVMLHEAARAELASRPRVALGHLEEASRTARASLAEARRVVWALRPESLEEGSLTGALDELAEQFRSQTGVDARSAVSGEARALGGEAETSVLRVAQEALANVRRHARATRVALTLTYLDDSVLLDVRDDGIGFEPESAGRNRGAQPEGGFGLTGMRERLEQHGGALTIESAPGAGTAIVARLPAPASGRRDDERRSGLRPAGSARRSR